MTQHCLHYLCLLLGPRVQVDQADLDFQLSRRFLCLQQVQLDQSLHVVPVVQQGPLDPEDQAAHRCPGYPIALHSPLNQWLPLHQLLLAVRQVRLSQAIQHCLVAQLGPTIPCLLVDLPLLPVRSLLGHLLVPGVLGNPVNLAGREFLAFLAVLGHPVTLKDQQDPVNR